MTRKASRAGALIIISAPSGAGKTSLVKGLIERCPDIKVSVSHTTRRKRPAEVEDLHYHFTDPETFQRMVAEDAFLEYAEVFGHHYGTAKQAVSQLLEAGYDVVLEIDWQGARQVRANLQGGSAKLVSIFILPPSRAALTDRLRDRGQDEADVIEHRLTQAVTDMSHHDEFDHVIVNDDFEDALSELMEIVEEARHGRRKLHAAPPDLVQELLSGARPTENRG